MISGLFKLQVHDKIPICERENVHLPNKKKTREIFDLAIRHCL